MKNQWETARYLSIKYKHWIVPELVIRELENTFLKTKKYHTTTVEDWNIILGDK